MQIDGRLFPRGQGEGGCIPKQGKAGRADGGRQRGRQGRPYGRIVCMCRAVQDAPMGW